MSSEEPSSPEEAPSHEEPSRPEEPPRTGGSRRRGRVVLVGVAAVIAVGVAAAGLTMLLRRDGDGDGRAQLEVVTGRTAVTHSFVVPAGAAERTAHGEDLGIVPQRLEVRVGDTIRIRNEDSVDAKVGIFTVGPHQSVTMRFTNAGLLEGSCDVHPSGRFEIEVLP